eukprot:412182-Hanusia_phi.AAC.1
MSAEGVITSDGLMKWAEEEGIVVKSVRVHEMEGGRGPEDFRPPLLSSRREVPTPLASGDLPPLPPCPLAASGARALIVAAVSLRSWSSPGDLRQADEEDRVYHLAVELMYRVLASPDSLWIKSLPSSLPSFLYWDPEQTSFLRGCRKISQILDQQ